MWPLSPGVLSFPGVQMTLEMEISWPRCTPVARFPFCFLGICLSQPGLGAPHSPPALSPLLALRLLRSPPLPLFLCLPSRSQSLTRTPLHPNAIVGFARIIS